jgi:ABC-type transport system substrate-binding protein
MGLANRFERVLKQGGAMKRNFLHALLLAALRLLLVPPVPVPPQESQVARVGLLSAVASLDPAFVETGTDAPIIEQLFLGLVEIDEEGDPQPELAEAWEAVDGTQSWTFHLRPGVQWADSYGNPQRIVTLQDVKWEIDRARELGLCKEIIGEVSQAKLSSMRRKLEVVSSR